MLLDPKGNWYKANLHCHCTVSDGEWTAEEIKERYQEQGYSVIAYTDHMDYRRHTDLDDETFLTIGAFEANIDAPADEYPDWNIRPVYHLNFYDTRPEGRDCAAVPMPEQVYTIENVNRYIKARKDDGFLCCYNHPWWSVQTYEDYIPLENLDFFEIYNHGCELDGLYGYAPQAYDEMLRTGHKALRCLATDDNHDRSPLGDPRNDSFGGFTMIQAPELRYDAIIKALQNGSTYASMGPLIHGLYLEENRLVIECSPVESIYLITQGRDGQWLRVNPGESLTRAEFPLTGNEGYVRIQIRDGRGLYANTNAYDVKELLSQESAIK